MDITIENLELALTYGLSADNNQRKEAETYIGKVNRK